MSNTAKNIRPLLIAIAPLATSAPPIVLKPSNGFDIELGWQPIKGGKVDGKRKRNPDRGR